MLSYLITYATVTALLLPTVYLETKPQHKKITQQNNQTIFYFQYFFLHCCQITLLDALEVLCTEYYSDHWTSAYFSQFLKHFGL